MTDTYARVMGPADEPENRRTTRSRTSRGSGAASGGPAAAEASGETPEVPPTPIGASRTPAGKLRATAKKPRTSRTTAKRPKTSGATAETLGAAAEGPGTAARASGSARAQGSSAQAQGSAAETTFAGVAAAFMAGRDAQARQDLQFEDVPAPKRLAPYATAIAATVQRDDADVAWGRLVLLYDPDGQQGWDGFYRLVAYIRAEVEPEIAADPLLGEVGWSWLSEALDAHVPGYAVPSGTVTRVITEGFGAKRDELPLTGFELRASWSPAGPGGASDTGSGQSDLATLDFSAHIAAWCDCLSAAAGLEPPGTRALRQPGYG
jgi:hypothetical protein